MPAISGYDGPGLSAVAFESTSRPVRSAGDSGQISTREAPTARGANPAEATEPTGPRQSLDPGKGALLNVVA